MGDWPDNDTASSFRSDFARGETARHWDTFVVHDNSSGTSAFVSHNAVYGPSVPSAHSAFSLDGWHWRREQGTKASLLPMSSTPRPLIECGPCILHLPLTLQNQWSSIWPCIKCV